MNPLQRFNDTLSYLESISADENIDYNLVQQLSGYSYPLFARFFAMLADMGLREYLRNRRLSKAAFELRNSTTPIIDIALMCGYSSANAFTAAFRKFHGETPSAVRAGAAYHVFTPLHFAMTIKGGYNMNCRIEQKSTLHLAGLLQKTNDSSNFGALWQRLYHMYDKNTLTALGNGQSYGVCSQLSVDGEFTYYAAYDCIDADKARAMGLYVLQIPAAEYAILDLQGAIPECIHAGWRHALEVVLPAHNLQHAGTPDLEVYGPGTPNQASYRMELWIPIQQAS